MPTRTNTAAANDAQRIAFSIKEFCDRVGISIQLFFKLPPEKCPRSFLVNRRRLISDAAAREWIADSEAQSNSVAT